MDHSITILSEKEKAILESYMLSADGLAEFWGENCEVIIHDLTQLDASVVKIVNGHLSGRQVGAPISEVTLNFVNKMMATPGMNFAKQVPEKVPKKYFFGFLFTLFLTSTTTLQRQKQ